MAFLGISESMMVWVYVGGAVVAAVLILFVGLAYFCCRKRKMSSEDFEPSAKSAEDQPTAERDVEAAAALAPKDGPPGPKPKGPAPPWEVDGTEVPPLMMANVTPATFEGGTAVGRAGTQRLLLLSSRVKSPELATACALSTTTVITYDWKNWTLQELFAAIKKAVASAPEGRVRSIAIMAPASKPGAIGLLEGYQTTPEKLANKRDLEQFWKALAALVEPDSGGDGGRIDLLNCRIVEDISLGAELLQALHSTTGLPFAASDDMASGYNLATFLASKGGGAMDSLTLVFTNLKALPMYFDATKLMAGVRKKLASGPRNAEYIVAKRAAGGAANTGAAPGKRIKAGKTTVAPEPAPQQTPAQAAPAAQPKVAAQKPTETEKRAMHKMVSEDIFVRFVEAIDTQKKTSIAEVFRQYDKDKSGQLSIAEVANIVKDMVSDADSSDIMHIRVMMDTDDSGTVSLTEFENAVTTGLAMHEDIRQGIDEWDVLGRLHSYFLTNETILAPIFKSVDKDGNGLLDAEELYALVSQIPKLEPDDVKYAMAYLHQMAGSDKKLSLQELIDAIRPHH